MEIQILHKHGKSIHEIDPELSVSRWKVRKYLSQICAIGYNGGISILKDWLLSQRPAWGTPAIIRFE